MPQPGADVLQPPSASASRSFREIFTRLRKKSNGSSVSSLSEVDMNLLDNQQPEKSDLITPFEPKSAIVSQAPRYNSPDESKRAPPMTPLADTVSCKKLDLTSLSQLQPDCQSNHSRLDPQVDPLSFLCSLKQEPSPLTRHYPSMVHLRSLTQLVPRADE